MSRFLVYRDWIKRNQTKRGGWTKGQLAALGIKWPPEAGWMDRVEGMPLTWEEARRFEFMGREGDLKTTLD